MLTFNIICSVAFGQEARPVRAALAADFEILVKAVMSIPLKIPFTRFSKGMSASARIRKVVTDIAQQREKTLQLHLQQVHGASSTDDFITYMLLLRSEGAHSLTLEDIFDNAIAILIAGYETSSVLITFMIRHLANEPDVLDKISEGA